MSDILQDPSRPVTVEIDGSACTYQVRVPSVMDRALYDREVRKAGGREWTVLQMLDAAEEGAREVLADQPETLDKLLGEIDEFRAAVTVFNARALGGELGDQQELIAAVREMNHRTPFYRMWEQRIADRYEPLQDMIGDNGAFGSIKTIVACRMFLIGWNAEQPFVRSNGRAPDRLLSGLPSSHLNAIATRVQQMLNPTESMGNGFASPSGKPSDPTRSATLSDPETTPTSPPNSTLN